MSDPDPRRPPSVERLLAATRPRLGARDHEALVAASRAVLAEERRRLADGADPTALADLASELVERVDAPGPPRGGLVPVINATGVILHTNLGRASWPAAAIEAAREAAAYDLLELDRSTGRRGRRFRAAEEHLVALTGAEDALVTNNNAAALVLAVGLAGRGDRVAVSRGELIEIGGGVRIPEIVRRAGVRLVEVGTTNRTRVADYAEALAEGSVRVVLRVHASNFRMEGFVERPDAAALAQEVHEHGAWLIDDLGSGALLDTARFGLAHEPTPQESLAAGADLVTFSGDKLVGGPQAGLIVGRAALIARLRRDPLARAMRADKVTLAAVTATLALYRTGQALAEIPTWRMIATPVEALAARADALARAVRAASGSMEAGGSAETGGAGWSVEAVPLEATVGGGSLPGETMLSWGLRIEAVRPAGGRGSGGVDQLLAHLRSGDPSVVGRIAEGAVVLDLRAVPPEADRALLAALGAALR